MDYTCVLLLLLYKILICVWSESNGQQPPGYKLWKTPPDGGVVAQVINHKTMVNSADLPRNRDEKHHNNKNAFSFVDPVCSFLYVCDCVCWKGVERMKLNDRLKGIVHLLNYCNGPVSCLTIN